MKLLTLLLSFIIFSFLSSNLLAYSQTGANIKVPVINCPQYCANAFNPIDCTNKCTASAYTDPRTRQRLGKILCSDLRDNCSNYRGR